MRSPFRTRCVRVLAAIASVLVLGLSTSVPVRADTKAELEAAKEKLSQLVDKIAAETETVKNLQVEASQIAAAISAVETRIALTQETILRVEGEIDQAQREIERQQGLLDERARTAYMFGPGTSLEFILGSTSLTDLTDRLEIVNAAAQSDQEIIDAVTKVRTKLELKEKQLERLKRDLAATRDDLREQERALQAKLTAAQAVVDSLESDRSEAQALVEKLEVQQERELAAAAAAAAAALAAQAAQTAQAAPTAQGTSGGGAVIGGVLKVCPVDPPRAYSDDFGAPRYGGGFHYHQGNDIFAPYETAIRAPFDGVASDASNDLGGMAVYVHGSLGYVYNAHLSSIGQLGPVSAGTIIGYVGDSGDAQGTSPHDHFEWHPGGGSAVDPFAYLNSVC